MADQIPTEALEAAARVLADKTGMLYDIRDTTRPVVQARHREVARLVIAAAAAHLIAEGRRQAAEAIRAAAEREEQPVIRLRNGNYVRSFELPEWAARIAEGTTERTTTNHQGEDHA